MKQDKNPWQIISSAIKYENPWTRVWDYQVIEPGGKPGVYGVVDSLKHGVRIVAELPDGRLVMNREFRFAANKSGFEFPAGGVLPQADHLQCAKEELYEETGLKAAKWTFLQELIPWPSVLTLRDYVFLAQDVRGTLSPKNREGNEGVMANQAFTLLEINKLIASGEIFCSTTIASFYLYLAASEKLNL